jgi:hypothetical protein
MRTTPLGSRQFGATRSNRAWADDDPDVLRYREERARRQANAPAVRPELVHAKQLLEQQIAREAGKRGRPRKPRGAAS